MQVNKITKIFGYGECVHLSLCRDNNPTAF